MLRNEDLVAARANLWKAQERFGCWPACQVLVNGFEAMVTGTGKTAAVLNCTMPEDLLHKIIHREVHWNNAEIGCLIEFDRRPNDYMPDVHTLMSFFHLPRDHDKTV